MEPVDEVHDLALVGLDRCEQEEVLEVAVVLELGVDAEDELLEQRARP